VNNFTGLLLFFFLDGCLVQIEKNAISCEIPMSFLVGPTSDFLQVFLHFWGEQSSKKMNQTK
jgi:hypothetical protein